MSVNDKFFDLKKEKQDRIINASLKIFALNEKDSIINAVGDGFNGTTVTV